MPVSGSLVRGQSYFQSPNSNVAANRNELPVENSLATCHREEAQAAIILSGFAAAGQASLAFWFMVVHIGRELPRLMVSSCAWCASDFKESKGKLGVQACC